MTFEDRSRRDVGPHQILVEANGSPFAPCSQTKPVVDVLAGRKTNRDLSASDWISALEAADGGVAIHYHLKADHEWWLAYDTTDSDAYMDDLEGPYHLWTKYPGGGWSLSELPREICGHHLDELYGESDDDRCDIHRSKVVATRDAPEMVRNALRGDR